MRLLPLLRLGLVLVTACTSLQASLLYWARSGGVTNGNGNVSDPLQAGGFSTSFDTAITPQSGAVRMESWSATANISDGTLKLKSQGSINGGAQDFLDAQVNTFADFGTTITSAHTVQGASGLNLSTSVTINGSPFVSQLFPGDVLSNFSYIRIMYLHPGSFDTPNFFAPQNIISQEFFGLGPDAQELPFGVAYSGSCPTFPCTINFPIGMAALQAGDQIAVIAQDWLEGTMPQGGQGLSWIADLSHTINVELDVPDGASVTVAGGLPVVTASSTPEPGSFSLLLIAGIAAGFGRQRWGRRIRE